jgi:hypothetical protein
MYLLAHQGGHRSLTPKVIPRNSSCEFSSVSRATPLPPTPSIQSPALSFILLTSLLQSSCMSGTTTTRITTLLRHPLFSYHWTRPLSRDSNLFQSASSLVEDGIVCVNRLPCGFLSLPLFSRVHYRRLVRLVVP